MKQNKPYFSVVVPVFNEEKNVRKVHREIVKVMKKLSGPSEVIFVDDGSTDETFRILQKLKPIKIIQLRRNFGQSAALDAGIKNSQGRIIITLDGDGQNDPKDIPHLLKKLNEGYDVVCGWRHKRKDPFSKKLISQGARVLRKFLVNDGVHDSGCTLRVYKKECFEDLDLYGELHRMIPALLRWRGFKVAEIKVNHRPRKYGKTKYNWKRIIKGFLDMLGVWFWRKYESRPLHLFGALGLILISLSLAFAFYLGIKRLIFDYSLSDKIWPIVAATGFTTGLQLLTFGLVSNLIIQSGKKSSFYYVKKVVVRS